MRDRTVQSLSIHRIEDGARRLGVSASGEPRRILVTGGCGFIGATLVERLHRSGAKVRVLDDLSIGQPSDINVPTMIAEGNAGDWWGDRVAIVRGDIRHADVAARAAHGADAIVHLAANTGVPISIADPRRDCTVNVIGTFNMLEAARHAGVKRFVFASSSAPVGEIEPPIHEDVVPHPISPYGASKLAGEAYCHAFWRSFGVETVALRFGNVFGPRSTRKASVVAAFCQRIVCGGPLTIYGDGAQTRDFIFIDDLIDAIDRALAVEAIGGEVFQIATNKETTVREIAETLQSICRAMGLKPPTITSEAPRHGDVRRSFSDTSKAARMLGWRARYDLRRGLAATLSSFLFADETSEDPTDLTSVPAQTHMLSAR